MVKNYFIFVNIPNNFFEDKFNLSRGICPCGFNTTTERLQYRGIRLCCDVTDVNNTE